MAIDDISEPIAESGSQASSAPLAAGRTAAKSSRARAGRADLYAVVWRWHFYAGLISAPILALVIVTGALYVFRTELSAWRDQALEVVTPGSQRLTYAALRDVAQGVVPGQELEALAFHPEVDRSVRFVAHVHADHDHDAPGGEHDERHLSIFLDPYSGKVLGTRVEEDDFFAIVLQLHRNMLMGATGRVLTELVTSWAVLLLATGVYLWFPRGKKNVGVWVPRLRGKLYAVLRDWHAVSGVYLLPVGGLLIVTGLFFTQVWGLGFNTTVKKVGHWAPAWFDVEKVAPPQPNAPFAPLDDVVATLLKNSRPHDSITMRLAPKPGTVNKVFMLQDEDKNSYRMVAVDPYTAKSLAVVESPDLPFLYRVRLWAVSIHMGQIFGLTTKILSFVTALGLLGMCITGVWMWWQRRPTGRTGFPRRPAPRSLPLWGWAIVLLAAAVLPVAGVSMLVIGLADAVLSRLFGWASPSES